MPKWLPLLLLITGCQARFIDDRPPADLFTPLPIADLLAGSPDGGELPAKDGLVAEGTFEGRAGHAGSGSAQLHRVLGVLELRFGMDFSVSGAPGPVVFLSSRQDMGRTIEPQADITLAVLKSTTGVQTYAIPAGAELGRRHVFVYCQPLRVEIAHALLVDIP